MTNSYHPRPRTHELHLEDLVGPREQGESLGDFAERYKALNDRMENKYPLEELRARNRAIDENFIDVQSWSLKCSACGITGPSAANMHQATRLAQKAGWTHLRDKDGKSLRDDKRNLIWVCMNDAPDRGGNDEERKER